MIWVGSFKSLQSGLRKPRFNGAPIEVHTWLRSETGLISPFVDWLMSLITQSGCVRGKEDFVELALREAVSNAIIHGNRSDPRKLVHVRCCCEGIKGTYIIVRDQGHGFEPSNVPNPLAVENLDAEHGRGIHLMRLAMDEVLFGRKGTEVHMYKATETKDPRGNGPQAAVPQWLVKLSLQDLRCRIVRVQKGAETNTALTSH